MQPRKLKSSLIIFLTAAAMLLFLVIFLLISAFALPCQYDATFLGEMKYKLERLKNTEGKRIVVVGGSSVPFSLKSDLIEQYLPEYTAVDFGMYADMGVSVMLDWAKTEIHEGDIIIISPEQSEQTLSCYFSADNFWQCADGYFSLFSSLSSERKERAAAAFPSFAGRKLYYSVTGTPDPDGIYARSSFNEYGDIDYADRNFNIMQEHYNPNQPIGFDRDVISEDFIAELNEFYAYAAGRGAEVYYRFCPMNEQALEEGAASAIDGYYDYLTELLDFPVLGNPHNSVLAAEWFYDTNFHLNDSGATLFTRGLIDDIKLLNKDSTPTDIPTPPTPSFPERPSGEGDDSDADKFTYERSDDGWIISGVNAEGLRAQNLIVPYTYQGEKVTGIAADAFRGNTEIRQITIQDNIGLLYDGMFDGCSSLARLVLTGKPSTYTTGDGLRTGANFLIYVPKELETNSKLDYGWQKYAQYIRANADD